MKKVLLSVLAIAAISFVTIGGGNKVEIVHNGQTISVSTNAVQAHLNHGDVLAGDMNNDDPRDGGAGPDMQNPL